MPFEFLCEVKMKKIHVSLQKSELLVQKVTDATWWHCRAQRGRIKIANFVFEALVALGASVLSLLPSCCPGILSKEHGEKEKQATFLPPVGRRVGSCPQMRGDVIFAVG